MRGERTVRTRTHIISIGTSNADGFMYLTFQGGGGGYDLKLTDENKEALRELLSPTPTWSGILAKG